MKNFHHVQAVTIQFGTDSRDPDLVCPGVMSGMAQGSLIRPYVLVMQTVGITAQPTLPFSPRCLHTL